MESRVYSVPTLISFGDEQPDGQISDEIGLG